MIPPDLKGKKGGSVNLNAEAILWREKEKIPADRNPLLDPKICDEFVREVHKKYNLDFSFGGYLEDRTTLWKGSYLNQWKTYTHLGIDINAPSGTEIAIPFNAEVVKIDDDYPEEGGWGPRLIIKHESKPLYFIFAHLDKEVKVGPNQKVVSGDIIAKIGTTPFNGNWFPHLHVQTITEKYFNEIQSKNLWEELDGYGLAEETGLNRERFPDPTPFILFS